MANAIYTLIGETGRCFQLRADTEDTFGTLLYLGKSTFKETMVDVVDEIRSNSEKEDDFRTSEFLGLGEEYKEIPNLYPEKWQPQELDLARLLQRLASGEVVDIPPVEVELMEVPEEVIEEPEEILVDEVRPRVNIVTIEGKPETEDHTSLFDD